MLPDAAQTIAAFLAALRRRTLLQDACEALLAGAVASLLAMLILLRHAAGGSLAWAAAGVFAIAALGWIWLRVPARREPALVTLAEARQPALRNLLVTERELARAPDLARPYVRARVQRDAARVIGETTVADVIPNAGLTRPLIGATLVLALAAGIAWHAEHSREDAGSLGAHGGAAAAGSPSSSPSPAAGGIGTVTVTVTPPAYTGRPAKTLVDPSNLEALAGSRVALAIDGTARAIEREFGNARERLTPSNGGDAGRARFADALVANDTGVLTLTAVDANPAPAGATKDRTATADAAMRRLIAIAVTPDAPPIVRLTAPAKDLLLPDTTGSVTVQAEATDDIGLDSLTLHYTRVSGSGERYEFTEGDIPFTVSRQDARAWRGATTQAISSLKINEGDTFVYYAAATDRRPGRTRAVSDSYVIEIGKPGTAIAGGFAIPPDDDQLALSLNALIQKTEKLDRQRRSMPKPKFADAAQGLAIEQRMVRTQFLLSMGSHGHVEDEVEEAEHSDEIQQGRLSNERHAATTQAVFFMTRAETALIAADTPDALQNQRAALAAMQRALSQQRYFLRTLPLKGQIDLTRRLTGDLESAKASPRAEPMPADAARADRIRAALQALAAVRLERAQAATADASAANAEAPSRSTADAVRLSAGRVLALDPASADVRAASDKLLAAAREIDAGRASAAQALIQEAANVILPLARAAAGPSTGALLAPADRGLRGALLDAQRSSSPGGAR